MNLMLLRLQGRIIFYKRTQTTNNIEEAFERESVSKRRLEGNCCKKVPGIG